MCLHAVEKYEKLEAVNTQNNYEMTSKKWTDNKQTCPKSFVKVFKSQDNKFKIVQKNF